VGELEAQQQRACDSVAAKLETSFSPEGEEATQLQHSVAAALLLEMAGQQ
jgi:hypothetical protein